MSKLEFVTCCDNTAVVLAIAFLRIGRLMLIMRDKSLIVKHSVTSRAVMHPKKHPCERSQKHPFLTPFETPILGTLKWRHYAAHRWRHIAGQ